MPTPVHLRLLLSVTVVFLSACSVTLPLRGQMQHSAETFEGTATGHIDGAGELVVKTTTGSTCHGTFVYINSRQGSGTFHCDDGRTGPFDFVSTGSRGTGSGSLGGQGLTFTFGRDSLSTLSGAE